MRLTEEEKLSKKNHRKAVKYFNLQPGYVLHHKDLNLKYTDYKRYIEWRPEDLEVMTIADHVRFHWSIDGNERSENQRKAAIRNKNWVGEKNPNYGYRGPGRATGYKWTDEQRKYLSEVSIGKPGTTSGKKKITDGTTKKFINPSDIEKYPGFWFVSKH